MHKSNTVIILSDEHNRDILGCYGNQLVYTPNLDKIAKEGVCFKNAYTNSPVCVPARASFATGRYPHQIGAWDSVSPYDGSIKGWGARLVDSGHEVVSIGKLHFRNPNNNGFSREIIPMHVHNGIGWLSSLLRNPPARLKGVEDMANSIGAGETGYTKYDRQVTELACEWLNNAASKKHNKSWVLYIGFVAPHFPLIAPQEFYNLYNDVNIPSPYQYAEHERPKHPVLKTLMEFSDYDAGFDSEKVKIARQAYYGLCTFLDHNIGLILDTLESTGLADSSRVIYTSDHGDNMGNRGLWGKSVMYEDSVAIPLIIKGPQIPTGQVVKTPVSLVDLHPTITEFAGESRHIDDYDLPGESLTLINDSMYPERVVFSEYHDWSSVTGMFMLRKAHWKLVYYVGYPSQLFNLENDPEENNDLGIDPQFRHILVKMEEALRRILDMEAINKIAFADQAEKIKAHGGREAILKLEDLAYTQPP